VFYHRAGLVFGPFLKSVEMKIKLKTQTQIIHENVKITGKQETWNEVILDIKGLNVAGTITLTHLEYNDLTEQSKNNKLK